MCVCFFFPSVLNTVHLSGGSAWIWIYFRVGCDTINASASEDNSVWLNTAWRHFSFDCLEVVVGQAAASWSNCWTSQRQICGSLCSVVVVVFAPGFALVSAAPETAFVQSSRNKNSSRQYSTDVQNSTQKVCHYNTNELFHMWYTHPTGCGWVRNALGLSGWKAIVLIQFFQWVFFEWEMPEQVLIMCL